MTAQASSFRTRHKARILAQVKMLYNLLPLPSDQLAARAAQLLDGDVFIYPGWVNRNPPPVAPDAAAAAADNGALARNKVCRPRAQPYVLTVDLQRTRLDAKKVRMASRGACHDILTASAVRQYDELKGKGRAFSHPAILAVIKIIAFESSSKSKAPSIVSLMPDHFQHGTLPLPLYAFASTLVRLPFILTRFYALLTVSRRSTTRSTRSQQTAPRRTSRTWPTRPSTTHGSTLPRRGSSLLNPRCVRAWTSSVRATGRTFGVC